MALAGRFITTRHIPTLVEMPYLIDKWYRLAQTTKSQRRVFIWLIRSLRLVETGRASTINRTAGWPAINGCRCPVSIESRKAGTPRGVAADCSAKRVTI